MHAEYHTLTMINEYRTVPYRTLPLPSNKQLGKSFFTYELHGLALSSVARLPETLLSSFSDLFGIPCIFCLSLSL